MQFSNLVRRCAYAFLPCLMFSSLSAALCDTSEPPPVDATAINSRIATMIDVPALRGGITAIAVARRDSGEVVLQNNADIRLMPASNRKLFTTAAVLGLLGDDFTLTTQVKAEPPQSGDVAGDVYLCGGGDSLLADADLGAMASALVASGIKHIHGDVIGDGSLFEDGPYGSTWGWDTLTDDYAPVIAGLEVDDGVVEIQVSGGAKVGDPTSAAYNIGYDEPLTDNAVTGPAASAPDVDIDRPWRGTGLTLTGSVPVGDHLTVKAPVIDPALFAAKLFRAELIREGVEIDGRATTGKASSTATAVLAAHTSPPMSTYIAAMNKPSDNLLAESLVRVIGAQSAHHGTFDAGDTAEMAYFRQLGLDTSCLTFEDGSGVSRRDYVTANSIVLLLTAMAKRKDFDVFYQSLPVAGVDGTLKHRAVGTVAQGNVHAKTGTLTGACALAGYFQGKSGSQYSFAILMNNFPGKALEARSVQDAIVQDLIENL